MNSSLRRKSDCVPGELVARLEAASVGSRELDRDIAIKLEPKLWLRARRPDTVERNGRQVVIPRYTTSLDAALALAERVLDGDHSYTLFHDWGDFNRAEVQAIMDEPVSGEGKAATMPLALVIAILKARTAAETGAVGMSEANETKALPHTIGGGK